MRSKPHGGARAEIAQTDIPRTDRNFVPLMLEGSLMEAGYTFFSDNSLSSLFLTMLTHNTVYLGVFTMLNMAFSPIAQFLMGPHVKRLRNQPMFCARCMLITRSLNMLLFPLMLLGLQGLPVAGVFLALIALMATGEGLVVGPWVDVFARTISHHKRGALYGMQILIGGSLAFFCSTFAIPRVLAMPGMPEAQRYGLLFFIGSAVMCSSGFMMLFVRDAAREPDTRRVSYRGYLRDIPALFRSNRHFRQYAYMRALASFASMTAPFYLVFASTALGFDAARTAGFLPVLLAGKLLGGAGMGSISRYLGDRFVVRTGILLHVLCALCLSSLLLWPGEHDYFVMCAVVALSGMAGATWLGYSNYYTCVVDETNRHIYSVMSTLISLPFTLLPIVGGKLIDSFGYAPVLAVSLAGAAIALAYSKRLLSHGQIAQLQKTQATQSLSLEGSVSV